MSFVGRGVVVTTQRGSTPRRRPIMQVVPGLGRAPAGELVTPGGVVLRAAQQVGLLGRVELGDGAVGPGERAPAGLVVGKKDQGGETARMPDSPSTMTSRTSAQVRPTRGMRR